MFVMIYPFQFRGGCGMLTLPPVWWLGSGF
nr:MAG TPA: hypothetical protein [Caudoviricetes sp.]